MALKRTPWRPNRKPINPMSAKRRAKLAAEGEPNPSSTLATRKPVMAASKRSKDSGPDRATVDAVLERDGHSCVVCGGGLHGTRSLDWSIHHRKRRSQGGTNCPSNLVSVCGHGTAGCHGDIHAAPAKAQEAGWLLKRDQDPTQVLMPHAVHGYILLTADGSWATRRPSPSTESGD
jgi:5-methylcytosine-specific restriction endonuclease McrA